MHVSPYSDSIVFSYKLIFFTSFRATFNLLQDSCGTGWPTTPLYRQKLGLIHIYDLQPQLIFQCLKQNKESQFKQTHLNVPWRFSGVSLRFLFSVSEIHRYLAMRDGEKLLQLFPEKIILAFNQTSPKQSRDHWGRAGTCSDCVWLPLANCMLPTVILQTSGMIGILLVPEQVRTW